ncbi:MAG: hypothetical protein HQL18_00390 [Candidatus Omnitrophica bacterium]|nr:hypothetical protein [Candidatus Omnitrophota bacterium]
MLGHFLFQTSRRIISLVLIIALAFSPTFSYAQSAFVATLPAPGTMVATSDAFVPVLVKGLVVHPDKPLNFDFIVDSGNDSADQSVVKEQSQRMAQYFLAAITVPEEQLWVNLSPYEKDRVIEKELGQTVLGRDMLAQDYILKQVTSSLIYPEKGLGKEFWAQVYAEAQAKFGTTDIPVDTFNKVWIMPEKAEVYEKGNAVYVTDAKLRVMLDSDRTAMSQNASGAVTDDKAAVAKAVMREIVVPAIEKEVNEGKNFAAIRQVYHAAILAKWYRELIQNTLLADAYVGRNKVAGVTTDEKALKEEIYQRYIAAYKKGVFSYIKEEATATGTTLPRKYFSGGEQLNRIILTHTDSAMALNQKVGQLSKIDFAMSKAKDAKMDNNVPRWKKLASVLGLNWLAYRALKSGNSEKQIKAIQYFVARKDKKAIPAIANEVTTYDLQVRVAARQALETLGADRELVFQAHVKWLYSPDTIAFLGNFGDKRAIEPIVKVIDEISESFSYRETYRGHYQYVDGFIDRRTEEKLIVALGALKNLGADRETLFQENVKVVGYPDAVEFLGNLGDRRAVPYIKKMLSDARANDRTRYLAHEALERLGDFPQTSAEEKSFQVELEAIEFDRLDKYKGPDIIRHLGNLGDKRAIDPIAIILEKWQFYHDDNDGSVKKAALSALDQLCTDSDSQYRVGTVGLKSDHWEIRKWAIDMLVKSGHDISVFLNDSLPQSAYSGSPDHLAQNYFRDILHRRGDARGDYIYSYVPSVEGPEELVSDDRVNEGGYYRSEILVEGYWELRLRGADAAMTNDVPRWKKLAGVLGFNWLAYRALKNGRPEKQVKAIRYFVARKDRRAIGSIAEMVSNDNLLVRAAAREALEKLEAGRETIFQASIKSFQFLDTIEYLKSLGDLRIMKAITDYQIAEETRRAIAAEGIKKLEEAKRAEEGRKVKRLLEWNSYGRDQAVRRLNDAYYANFGDNFYYGESPSLSEYLAQEDKAKQFWLDGFDFVVSLEVTDWELVDMYPERKYPKAYAVHLEQGASLTSSQDAAQRYVNGGIDIQNIDVAHKNGSAKIQFNDQAIRDVLKNGFNGFTPVIINITPVQSPLMILGVNQAEVAEAHT